METITQTNDQGNIELETPFDQDSRERYFEMLEQAFINLSLVNHEMEELEALIEE